MSHLDPADLNPQTGISTMTSHNNDEIKIW